MKRYAEPRVTHNGPAKHALPLNSKLSTLPPTLNSQLSTMKHLSITSLFACSLLVVLLDIITPSTGCHKSKPYTRPTNIGIPILGLPPQTLEAESVGDTWAVLPAEMSAAAAAAPQYIDQYGIEYKESGTDSPYQKVPATEMKEDNKYQVRVTGLKAAKNYLYRAYLVYNSKEYTGFFKSFRTQESK